MTGEAPPHERLARQLIEGRVGGVCGDERGLARRVLGESHDLALMMRWNYARALYKDDRATHGDLRDAVTTLEETVRTARRVLGGAHPITGGIEECLRGARATLHAHETGDVSLLREGIERVATRDAK